MRLVIPILATAILAATSTFAADKKLLWGDTHLHTSYSLDAYTIGNFTADPHTAYRYAKGQPVIHPYHRARVQINTPLDFLVVSDHAEALGIIREIHAGKGVDTSELGLWDSLKARLATWYMNRRIDDGTAGEMFRASLPPARPVREDADRTLEAAGSNAAIPDMMDTQINAWRSLTNIADEYNEPGQFTAFIGWEWSSMPGGANLHRVVMMDGNAKQAQAFQPMSSLISQYPEDLWAWLAETEAKLGANFIAIPHNSNVSKGFMFDTTRLRGTPMDADYIAQRQRWEPIVEITQFKGDSESHPTLSPNDPFADFEEFPYYLQSSSSTYEAKPGDFVRSALKRGLSLEKEHGSNPYQFGVIGSTDAHTGLASAEEGNFWGKMATDSIPENKSTGWEEGAPSPGGWTMSASGLTAVWAEDNTRESILAAMKRKEVYATTGPRIGLQFFAGQDLVDIDLDSTTLFAEASGTGVPMGGQLIARENSPTFIVAASKGPVDANLDRVQIVKGWLDSNGKLQEKVYNVAWSGGRVLDDNGRLPAVGNTVDLSTGQHANSIGAAQLSAAWADPDYNASESAFYYVRVLQIPTARHSLLDAIALGLATVAGHPDTIQERAYSSPIWLKPQSQDTAH